MATITQQLKQRSVKGLISEKEALAVGQRADELLTKAVEILKDARPNFGLFVGGEIDTLISEINKVKLPVFIDREPDGQ